MVMLSALLMSIFSIGLLFVGLVLWQLRRETRQFFRLLEQNQQQEPVLYKDLTRQVDEIHQTMGGVVNGLKAVGNEVYNLNMLAGNVLQGDDMLDIEGNLQAPAIMIEIRPQQSLSDSDETQYLSPEDMSPEMLERFKVFQAVYASLMAKKDIPSRKRPDLN